MCSPKRRSTVTAGVGAMGKRSRPAEFLETGWVTSDGLHRDVHGFTYLSDCVTRPKRLEVTRDASRVMLGVSSWD